jgi:hypothetical protein
VNIWNARSVANGTNTRYTDTNVLVISVQQIESLVTQHATREIKVLINSDVTLLS